MKIILIAQINCVVMVFLCIVVKKAAYNKFLKVIYISPFSLKGRATVKEAKPWSDRIIPVGTRFRKEIEFAEAPKYRR